MSLKSDNSIKIFLLLINMSTVLGNEVLSESRVLARITRRLSGWSVIYKVASAISNRLHLSSCA